MEFIKCNSISLQNVSFENEESFHYPSSPPELSSRGRSNSPYRAVNPKTSPSSRSASPEHHELSFTLESQDTFKIQFAGFNKHDTMYSLESKNYSTLEFKDNLGDSFLVRSQKADTLPMQTLIEDISNIYEFYDIESDQEEYHIVINDEENYEESKNENNDANLFQEFEEFAVSVKRPRYTQGAAGPRNNSCYMQNFRCPASYMTAEDAFLYPNDYAEVEMPFVLNDIQPMSNEEIKLCIDEITAGAPGKFRLRLGGARQMDEIGEPMSPDLATLDAISPRIPESIFSEAPSQRSVASQVYSEELTPSLHEFVQTEKEVTRSSESSNMATMTSPEQSLEALLAAKDEVLKQTLTQHSNEISSIQNQYENIILPTLHEQIEILSSRQSLANEQSLEDLHNKELMGQEINVLNTKIDKYKNKIDFLLNLIEEKDEEYTSVKNDLDVLRLKSEDEMSSIQAAEESVCISFASPVRSSAGVSKKRSKTPTPTSDLSSMRRGTFFGTYTTYREAIDKRDELGDALRDTPILALSGQRWMSDLRSRSVSPEKLEPQTSRIPTKDTTGSRYARKPLYNTTRVLPNNSKRELKPDESYSYSKVYTQKQISGKRCKAIQSRIRNTIKSSIREKQKHNEG